MGENPVGSNNKYRTALIFKTVEDRNAFKNMLADLSRLAGVSPSEYVLSLVLEERHKMLEDYGTPLSPSDDVTVGQRIRHPVYGTGEVVSTNGHVAGRREISVRFDDGVTHVMALGLTKLFALGETPTEGDAGTRHA